MSNEVTSVASESLNYLDVKRRSIGARNYRVQISPTTSGAFAGNNSTTIEFQLPSNLSGSYLDMSQLYLKLTLNVATAAVNLDKAGIYSIFSRCEMFSSGSQICTINNYNLLASVLLDTDASIGYKVGAGKILTGCAGVGNLGEYIPSGGSRTFAAPVILLPMSMQKKLIPLFSLDSLRIRFTLENVATAFISAGAPTYTVSDVQLNGYICELSPSAQAQIDAMTGGMYQVLCPCYSGMSTTMSAQATAVTSTLGIAVSSLEKIMVVHRVSASITSQSKQSFSRITNDLTSFQFSIDAQLYPQSPITVGNAGAIILAEALISSHQLTDFRNDAPLTIQTYVSALTIGGTQNSSVLVSPYDAVYQSLNIPATSNVSNAWYNVAGDGTVLNVGGGVGTVSATGTFVAAIELENSTSSGNSMKLYSGLQTFGAVVQYIGNYTGIANNTVAANIDFFCLYTILCFLDMKTTGVWQVKV